MYKLYNTQNDFTTNLKGFLKKPHILCYFTAQKIIKYCIKKEE